MDAPTNQPPSDLPSPEPGGLPRDAIARIYDQLRAIAAKALGGERAGHTLQPTALVHEAYLSLAGSLGQYRDEPHFLATAARALRRILVDHARAKNSQKRGGKAERMTLDTKVLSDGSSRVDVLALEDAMEKLRTLDPRKHQIVEMKIYAEQTESSIAAALGVSINTVTRDWNFARAYLNRELGPERSGT